MKKGVLLLSLNSLVFYCCRCGNYGRLRLQSGPGGTMTTQHLKENWGKYHVIATGVEPGVPSAIIFDSKDDGREIIGRMVGD